MFNTSTGVWALISKLSVSRTAQVVRLLDAKAFDLRARGKELLHVLWGKLVVIDEDDCKITINESLEGEATDIGTALVSLQAFGQLEKEAKQFWESLDDLILKARIDLAKQPLRAIDIEDVRILLHTAFLIETAGLGRGILSSQGDVHRLI
jgi:hypothetical protein